MTRTDFEFTVPPGHPSLAGHFPGNPVVPGVLLLDAVLDAFERATGQRVGHLQRVKFTSALRPGEIARGVWDVEGARAQFRVTTLRAGVPTKVAQGAVSLVSGTAANRTEGFE